MKNRGNFGVRTNILEYLSFRFVEELGDHIEEGTEVAAADSTVVAADKLQ